MFTEEAAPLRPRNKHRDCLTKKLGKKTENSPYLPPPSCQTPGKKVADDNWRRGKRIQTGCSEAQGHRRS